MTPHELEKLWDDHLAGEFTTKDVEATLATMVDDASVDHIPVHTRRPRQGCSARLLPGRLHPLVARRPGADADQSRRRRRPDRRRDPHAIHPRPADGVVPPRRAAHAQARSTSTSSSWCSSATARSRASGSTGTRRRCSARWASTFPAVQKPEVARRACGAVCVLVEDGGLSRR